ncbi:DOPA-like domain-containing protein [Xylariaceae sp. FL1019]|nr:DOPA-like domain-containing protein [Xylariaceae sp. FL1019]
MRTFHYTYPSPLAGFENLPPLPDQRAENANGEDGHVNPSHVNGVPYSNPPYVNPQRDERSDAYDKFTEPLNNGRRGGFDVHIYYKQNNKAQSQYAKELWERIRREFPELRIYTFWEKPVGPHPFAMFEVDVLSPEQFGAFVPWLAIWRGPLSVLIHPNTVASGDHDGRDGMTTRQREARDHSERAIWMGERVPVDLDPFGDRHSY